MLKLYTREGSSIFLILATIIFIQKHKEPEYLPKDLSVWTLENFTLLVWEQQMSRMLRRGVNCVCLTCVASLASECPTATISADYDNVRA